MNNINPNNQESSSDIINIHTINDHHANSSNSHQDDRNLILANQLFDAYCKYSTSIDEMASILLSTLSLPSSQPQPSSFSSTPTTTSTTTTTTKTKTISSSIQSIITAFIGLRSQYIGPINTNSNPITTNNFSTNDIIFNYSLFHAALFTNEPIIIDAVIPYINYDFTTLHIPIDQIDDINQMNSINNESNEIYPSNYILQAIVEATEQGHYQSIQHLINNYQLSPTIPICDHWLYEFCGYTNLLYDAVQSKNLQLIEYLLPLCFTSTNQQVISELIPNIAQQGHLHLIQQLHNEYNINLTEIKNDDHNNILHDAVKSTNIELIDYLIEVIGLPINEPGILQSAIHFNRWDNVKHLITKYNVDIERIDHPLNQAVRYHDTSLDTIDFIITTFNITENEITNPILTRHSPLYSSTEKCNINIMKYLIEKYNANPHATYQVTHCKSDTLLHIAFNFNYVTSSQLLETVKYLCELGLDVNRLGRQNRTPIELLIHSHQEFYECQLPIFKLLLEYKAIIYDIDLFIEDALVNQHFSILQYFIETYQPEIDFNKILSPKTSSLFHKVIDSQAPIEFITYLLSLNTIDINKPDNNGKTPILYAMTNYHFFNIEIIKLLIQNGAKVTIDDWLHIFSRSLVSMPNSFFQRLDFFQATFGFNSEISYSQVIAQLLLEITLNRLIFRYSTIKYEKKNFNLVVIYRAFIHHYKANVNDQDSKTNNNTVFHNLATYNHYELIQFTLLHSHYEPNIYLINLQGETFLHILVSNYDQLCIGQWDKSTREDSQQSNPILSLLGLQYDDDFELITTDDELNDRYNNFEKVLDCIIDLLE